ncbi:MAG: hypothetical protein ACC662_05100 [Planctomycetota bacterium]
METIGGGALVGRCDVLTPEGILLLDGGAWDAVAGKTSREAWLRKAARVGVWKTFVSRFVPAARIASVRPLRTYG